MKKLVALFLVILFFGLILFNPLHIAAFDKFLSYEPCAKPIAYRIGTIDSRFGISEEQLLASVNQASDVWSTTFGKQLFSYDPEAILTINLVYDKRQDLSNQISNLKGQLDTDKDAMKPEIAEYERRSADFKKRLADLNAEIEKWNSQGGAPEEEYDKLKREQEELQTEAEELNVMAGRLNQTSDEFSAKVGSLNQTVRQFNNALTVRPEEGLYDPNNNTISIYFHTDQAEFVHTLAHELGHARGLGHVTNPNAIMNAQTNTNIAPTADDITALSEICRRKSYIAVVGDRFNVFYNFYFKRNSQTAEPAH